MQLAIPVLPHVKGHIPDLGDQTCSPGLAIALFAFGGKVFILELCHLNGDSSKEEVPPAQVVLSVDGFVCRENGLVVECCFLPFPPLVEPLNDQPLEIWVGVPVVHPSVEPVQ